MTWSALHLGGGKMRLSRRATMQPAAAGRMNQAPAFFNITAPERINNKKKSREIPGCMLCSQSRFRHDKRASCFGNDCAEYCALYWGPPWAKPICSRHAHIICIYRERKHSHLAAENNGKAQHESRVFLAARSLSTGNLTSSRHCQFAFDKKI